MEDRFRAMIGRDDGWFARRGIAAEPALKQESCRERESPGRKCNRAMWEDAIVLNKATVMREQEKEHFDRRNSEITVSPHRVGQSKS